MSKVKKCYVYCLRRPDKKDPISPDKGLPFYIGSGIPARVRFWENLSKHGKESYNKNNYYKNNHISTRTVIYYLWENKINFEVDILIDNLSRQDARELEGEWIALYGRIGKEINGLLTNEYIPGEQKNLIDPLRRLPEYTGTRIIRENWYE